MYLDILLILILAAYTVFGVKNGSVKMIYRAASRWGSIIVVCLLLNPVVEVMSATEFAHNIYDGVYDAVSAANKGSETVLEDMNDVIGRIASQAAVSDEGLISPDAAAVKATTSVLKGMFFFILFIPVRLIFFIIYKLLDTTAGLPLIRSASKLLGAAVGAANGLIITFVLFKAAEFVSLFVPFGFDAMLDGSVLVRALISII